MSDRPTNDEPFDTITQSGLGAEQPAHPAFIPFARPVVLEAISLPPLVVDDPWPTPMSRLRAIVELIILVPVTFIGMLIVVLPFSFKPPADTRWLNILSSVGLGVSALTACILMMAVARHKPASIGWTARNLWVNVALGIAATIALYAAVFLPLGIAFPQLSEQSDATQKAIERTFPPMPIGWTAIMLTFVAIWEEVIFRGFVMTRLQAIFRRWWLTIPVASIIFGVSHGYEGALAMVMITILALTMSLLFVWRKSLVAPMVLHWTHNMFTLLILRLISTTWR